MTIWRTSARSGALLAFLTLAPGAPAAPAARADATTVGTADQELAALRKAIDERRYDEAEAGARALLARLDPAGDGESVAIARTLDLILEARGKSTTEIAPETRAGGARAAGMWEQLAAGKPLPGGEGMSQREREAALAASLSFLCASRSQVSTEYAKARQDCERSLMLRRAFDPPDPAGVAESAITYGILLRRLGEYEAARPLMEEALAARRAQFGEQSRETSQSLNALGNLLAEMGLYAEARASFERSLAIREAILGPWHHNVGTTLNNLGILLWMAGEMTASRQTLERALEVRRKALGPEHPEYALTMENLANVLADLGDLVEARRLYEEAIPILEKKLGPEDTEVAAALHNLSTVLVESGDRDAARRAIERSVAIRAAALPADHQDLAGARVHLANLLRDAGDLEASRALYEQALAALDGDKPIDPRHLCLALGDHALLLARTGDLDGARKQLLRAVAIREEIAGSQDFYVVESLLHLARTERAAGNSAKAMDLALDAAARMRENLAVTVRLLPERQALRYEAVRGRAVDLALAILAGREPADAARLWDAVVRARAVVLDEMARRHAVALRSGDPEVAALVRDLDAARSELANLLLRNARPNQETPQGARESPAEAVRRAGADKERLEQALGRKSGQFRSEQDAQGAGLAEVTARLRPGDAMVAFVHYRDPGPPAVESAGPMRYAAFVTTAPGGAPAFVRLGEAEKIDAAIAAWRGRASSAPEDDRTERAYRQAALAVRRVLWDPLAARIGKAKRVFVVPDGAIQAVSFATLPAPEGGYLLEKGPLFHYLAAERDLARAPAAVPALGAGLLAMGGPDFDAVARTVIAERPEGGSGGPGGSGGSPGGSEGNANGGGAGGEPGGGTGGEPGATTRGAARAKAPACPDLPDRFAPLPNASKEVEEIVALYGRRKAGGKEAVATLAGAAAGEAALRDAAPGRRIVHLAPHAFVADERCAATPQAAANPLLFSGLALAGANRRSDAAPEAGLDDGLLTAEEIASLDLRGVEWVVLSACETGVGPVQSGEGVLGLRRSFQIAGAASLILTLWKVDDVAAREWIRDLYEARLSGKDTAESVRAASVRRLAALRKAGVYDHPFSWGAFVATGDWH